MCHQYRLPFSVNLLSFDQSVLGMTDAALFPLLISDSTGFDRNDGVPFACQKDCVVKQLQILNIIMYTDGTKNDGLCHSYRQQHCSCCHSVTCL